MEKQKNPDREDLNNPAFWFMALTVVATIAGVAYSRTKGPSAVSSHEDGGVKEVDPPPSEDGVPAGLGASLSGAGQFFPESAKYNPAYKETYGQLPDAYKLAADIESLYQDTWRQKIDQGWSLMQQHMIAAVASKKGKISIDQVADEMTTELFVGNAPNPFQPQGSEVEPFWWAQAVAYMKQRLVELSRRGLNVTAGSSFFNLYTDNSWIHERLFPLWVRLATYDRFYNAYGDIGLGPSKVIGTHEIDRKGIRPPAQMLNSAASILSSAGFNAVRGSSKIPYASSTAWDDVYQTYKVLDPNYILAMFTAKNSAVDNTGTRSVEAASNTSTTWFKRYLLGVLNATKRNRFNQTRQVALALRSASSSWDVETWATWYVFAGFSQWKPKTNRRNVKTLGWPAREFWKLR